MRIAGIASFVIGFVFIAVCMIVDAYSVPVPLFLHGSLGLPFIIFGIPLCVLGWIGEGFAARSTINR